MLPPSLKGRGWGWVAIRIMEPVRQKPANPPPAPPFQGGEKNLAPALKCSPAKVGVQTGLPPSRENNEGKRLAFQLAHQHAHSGIDIAI